MNFNSSSIFQTMHLRLFRPGDLEELYRIDQTCFSPNIAYSIEELSRFIGYRSSRTWVAEENGEVAGFLIASRHPPQVGHIVTIDVQQQWRRQGVGTLMMDAAENWAREEGARSIYLETGENNPVAQRFYGKRGYRKINKIENYYADGTAAWVMMKRLDRAATESK